MMKIFGAIVLLILIAGAIWFFAIRDASTSIGAILQNPRDYEAKMLTISGEVTGGSNLIVVKYFTLNDGTGEIKVVTQKAVPSSGAKVTVRGKIEQAFRLGDIQALVFIEE